MPAGQVGEPGCDLVHLIGRHLADVVYVAFPWSEAPLRIEGQADVGLGQ